MPLTSFRSVAAFRAWLKKHHQSRTELRLRCYKTAHASRGVTYREALDEALCFGWIDGVRHAVDTVSFSQRFSPRRPSSAWSTVNIRRYRELEAEGRIQPSGAAAFVRRTKPAYSYESRPRALSPAFQKRLRRDIKAWPFFRAQPPWYQRICAFWIMSAKQPDTRLRRFAVLLKHSQAGSVVPPLKRPDLQARRARRT